MAEVLVGGMAQTRAVTDNFWQVLINYSTIHRLLHVWIGAFILGAFFVMSISAWYILKKRHDGFARMSFSAALVVGAISSLAALIQGDLQAKNVYEHQPAKLAAFEGHFQTGPGNLHLFGLPDADENRVKYGVAIPGGLSFLLFYDWATPVTGLDRFPPDERPPLFIPFMSFHLMVGLGVFFIAITLAALCFWWRGTLFEKRWLMWIFVFAVVGPYIANEVGWAAAEVGRQPWIVQGILKTSDAFSPNVSAGEVLGSITMFGLIYLLLFAIFIYLLDAKIRLGPEPAPAPRPTEHGYLDTAARLASPAGESLTDARGEVHDRTRHDKKEA
jgi:cytochrome d ubiquinol oxidase subunit I